MPIQPPLMPIKQVLSLIPTILGFWILGLHIKCAIHYQILVVIRPFLLYSGTSVKLPNRSTTIASCIGTVPFKKDLILHHVLLIAKFHGNLISVSKIYSSLDYKLGFDSICCTIKDLNTLRTIELAQIHNSLC